MDTSKIIKGVVNSGRYTVTAPIAKEDYGLYLQIEGIELPSTYEVDFSNSEHNGTSVTMIGNADGVLIPHQFIDTGKDIFAFLYHVGANYGRTVYKFRIPNKLRPDRTEETPTPEEQSVIDQTISALNEAVAQTAQDVIDADASAQSASADAERAEEARTDAQNYATQAEQARDDAQTYANNASASATASANSASASAQIKADVEDLAEEAQGYAQASAQSATASANSASQAQGYAQSASASAQSASGYASNAQTSANTASNKASEASTSAQTASTKATEASQSATTASNKATEASGYATASQTAQGLAESARDTAVHAKTDAESARDEAVTAKNAVQGSADQIATNTADITDLKEDLSDIINGKIVFGEITKNEYVVKSDGSFAGYTGWNRTGYVDIKRYSSVILSEVSSSEYNAFYDSNKEFIKAFTVGTSDTDISIPNNAKYMVLSNTAAGIESLNGTYITKTDYNVSVLQDYVEQINDTLHVLYAEGTPTVSNSRVMHNGVIESSSASDRSDYITIPSGCDRVKFKSQGYSTVDMVSFFTASNVYISGVEATNNLVEGEVSIPSNAEKVILTTLKTVSDAYIYIYSSNSIASKMDTVTMFTASNKNVLVFGDSITDCCNLTVSNGITTAYSFRDPSNSYINAGGQTVNYYMWPFIFNKLLHCNEMRNYARTGASYKDAVRTNGEERQNLSYQINLSIADLENAGGAFAVNDFNPDIIIMALGTNDGTPNDTPQSAYAKIVTDSDGIDVDATLTALDRTKFCEAVLWANLMIRKHFVDALYCVVLPLQRMSGDNSIGTLHEYIKEIAQRFGGAIIIDGAYDSGIVKCNNVISGLGATLKDGLHPNEIGQNMMARMIMSSVNSHFVDYANMQ